MSARPKLSIVMPSFQSRLTLARAVESVLRQDFESWELLIVDDGSDDGSLVIAADYASTDPRIQVFREAINRGPGPPSNFGIKQATGDYILFLHSDDQFVPGFFQKLWNEIQKFDSDLLLFGAQERRSNGMRMLFDSNTAQMFESLGPVRGIESEPRLLWWSPSAWTRCYRREWIVDNHISFPEGTYEDIPWTLETTLRAPLIRVVNLCGYEYSTGEIGSSITTTQSVKSMDRVRQLVNSRSIVIQLGLSDLTLSYVVALMSIHLIWGNRAAYRNIPEDFREQFFLESAQELSWWWQHAQPGPEINSDALLNTSERVFFTRALLSGSYPEWQSALATHQRKLSWRRRFDLSRYGLFTKR